MSPAPLMDLDFSADALDAKTMTMSQALQHDTRIFKVIPSADSWWLRRGVSLALLALTGVVVGETITNMHTYAHVDNLHSLDGRFIANGVTTASILLWPMLWDLTVGLDVLVEKPRMLFGFYWPMVVSSLNLPAIMDTRLVLAQSSEETESGLTADAQAIISAAFAMGALLATTKSVRGTHIIMYAMIACLALVVPNINTADDQHRAVVYACQRASLNYAIGFIVAGIGADFLAGGASSKRYAQVSA